MSSRKNHHYVPQFYFRYFSKDGRSICALTVSTGKTVSKAPIKSQASKSWFYGNDQIEAALGEIEGACSASLRALQIVPDPTQMTGNDIDQILIWLALQRSRTRAARDSGEPMRNKLAELLSQIASNGGHDRTDVAGDHAELSPAAIDYDVIDAQVLEMDVAMESAQILRDLVPVLLINKTNRPFIFSDAPVVFYNAHYRDVKYRGVLGYDTPGLLVLFPLCADRSLLLLDPAVYRTRGMKRNTIIIRSSRDVISMNKLQLHSASSCVYFHDGSFSGYVAELWRQEQNRIKPSVAKVVETPGFDHDGNPIGDVVHNFQAHLNYRLALTFLEHQTLDDRQYRFSRRGDRYVR
ncbi:DUF4238 domain-containing protein [Caballeronia sp. LjRoot29]|uniref:DUF4238 domain-containing protein n=1 Tax=Caballeronia sp. LjRoot29 TaxID=3342315 RepID=UPI003ECD5368